MAAPARRMHRAEFLRLPDADLMVIALANRHDAMDHWDLYQIADLYLAAAIARGLLAAPSPDPSGWSDDQLAGCFVNSETGAAISC